MDNIFAIKKIHKILPTGNHNHTSTNLIDVRDILIFINILILIGSLWAFRYFETKYVDLVTLFLQLILVVQNIYFIEKHKKFDHIIFLLVYIVTFFYSARILTLIIFGWSDVFNRANNFDSANLNKTLFFIICANIFFYAGTFLHCLVVNEKLKSFSGRKELLCPIRLNKLILSTLILIALMIFLKQLEVSSENIILKAGLFLLAPQHLIICLIPLVFIYRKIIKKHYIYTLVIIYFLMECLNIRGGSRGGSFIYFLELLLIIFISSGLYKLKKTFVNKIIIVSPLIIFIGISVYTIGGMYRQNDNLTTSQSFHAKVEKLISLEYGYFSSKDHIGHIFSRLGYLDFDSELIANSKKYAEIFNIDFYIKSFIDNGLTPGFDIYDTPRIGNSLIFKFGDINGQVISKKFLTENSVINFDQLGLYGEIYSLFSWFGIFFFFIFGFLIKTIIERFKVNFIGYKKFIGCVLTCIFFKRMICSFGIPYTIVEIMPIVMVTLIIIFIIDNVVALDNSYQSDLY